MSQYGVQKEKEFKSIPKKKSNRKKNKNIRNEQRTIRKIDLKQNINNYSKSK